MITRTLQIEATGDFWRGRIKPKIPGEILATVTGTIPTAELPIAVYAWFNTPTRTYWASFDLIFGAAPLDTTAGLVIASGTPS